jgi:hypothetical protein
MKFALSIQIGNDAMQTWEHVTWALDAVARQIRESCEGEVGREASVIMDANGNIVGRWSTKGGV